uniref:class A beta-lactamase ASU1-1 n=1 Tax=uncultured bacterium TaxID=77133 RepID=UPI001C32AC6A|nr:class A beta-lactamase ASU1-1 [uncultured bacterium]QWJ89340.1 class A beta-lactamase ASU1-1 [uncultured bacterium]
MKKVILLTALFITACGGDVATTSNNSTAVATPEPYVEQTPGPRQSADAELERQFAEIAKEVEGKVGVAAVVLETGQNAAFNGDERFAMQSVYKVPISMAVMKQIDAGKYQPNQEIEIKKEDFVAAGQRSPLRDSFPNGTKVPLWHLIEYAVSQSDGTASDVLLRLAGGPAEVQKYITEIGITDMAVKNTEKELGTDVKIQYDNYSTPNAAVKLLAELKSGVSIDRERSKLIRDFMNESPTGPNRLRGLLPEAAYVAHKTGTSGTRNGVTAATNDIGIINLPNGKFLLIAVFVGDSPADEKARDAVIAKMAKAAWDKWGA